MDKTPSSTSPPPFDTAGLAHAKMLGQALDGATCLVAIKDLNHRYLYANKKLEALYGAPHGSMVGTSLEAYVSIKYVIEMQAREQHVIQRGTPSHFFERLLIHGRPHAWESIRFPFHDASGNLAGSCFVAIDIDEGMELTDEQRETLRRANDEVIQHRLPDSQGSDKNLGLIQLQWRTFYECGNPTIDRQHLALFQRGNQLLNAVLSDAPADETRRLMRGLMQEITQHFHDEESILRQAAYPHAEEHHAIHLKLLSRANQLAKQFETNHVSLEELFRFLAQDVISHHLLGEDRDYFAFIDRHFPIEP